ncbi:hypothetical protein [Parafrankia sp. FMc2]|uniref:hypothetical protein n=1 Tax=Parafrankia sp. FMc2 TaxID=3233196 RepID=UPI0034D727AA
MRHVSSRRPVDRDDLHPLDRILVDKAALARTVVGGGESWLASLSTDELWDLVARAPEAVDA